MTDRTPLSLWRRLLALPIESQSKTIMMAFLVAAASALLVSTAAVLLQPRINANLAAERQARLDAMIAALPGLADILAASGADRMDSVIVNLNTGLAASDISSDDFDMRALAEDPEMSTELNATEDFAGIRRRPDFAQINLARSGEAVALVVLPVYAAGYQSTITAYLALEADLNTVAGLAITDQAETPGLGAKIAEPGWQALWPGKKLADENGDLRLSVVRGSAVGEFEVDGITGATRTGNAISGMIQFWLGPDGYGPVLEAIRAGRL